MFAIDILRRGGKRPRGTITPQLGYQNNSVSSGSAIDISGLGCQAGDVLVIGMAGNAGSSDTAAPSISGNQTGAFAAAIVDLYSNDFTDTNLFGYVQKLTGADTSITVTGASGAIQILRFTGVDLVDTLDVPVQTATGLNTDLADPPAITPITPGAQIVVMYAGAQTSNTAWGTPSGLDSFSTVTGLVKVARGRKGWSGSGAFDPPAIPSGQNNSQNSWAAFTLALRPAYL